MDGLPANLSVVTLTEGNLSNASVEGRSLPDLYAIHHPSIAIIDRLITPIWYAIGFPGNLLSFVVWVQPRMRPSSGCYLATLAAADFVFLVLHLFFELQSAWGYTTLSFPVLCEVFPVFFLASQYLSPLLVLGFTVERFISVCYPFQRERLCNSRRTVFVIVGICSFSLSLHVVQTYFWYYDYSASDCQIRPEVEVNGIWSLWSVWSYVTELLVFGVVPLTILVLNVRVICEARKLSANEENLLFRQGGRDGGGGGGGRKGAYHKSSAPSATTVMLLAVSFYLIATTVPATVAYTIYYSFPNGSMSMTPEEIETDAQWQSHFGYWKARTIIQEICMSHYAGNFIIYVLTGRIFRRELIRLFHQWTRLFCRRSHQDLSWNGYTSYTKAEVSCNMNGVTTV